MERTDVVIVGAGGGGAVLGLALAQKGIKNIVLEQAPGPPTGLRGEILQPNGQQILDRLGVLSKLPVDATRSVRYFHFCKVGGAREGACPRGEMPVSAGAGRAGATSPGAGGYEKLCTADYGTLPPPYNRAIVTLPNAAHHAILEALEAAAPGALRYGASFKGLRREGERVVGVDVECGGQTAAISAQLVVGADGAYSKVREALGIPTNLHLYREGYLIAILDSPDGLDEGRYFVGRGEILGLFPAAGRKVYLFDMIPAGSMEQVKAQGLEARQNKWIRIDPSLEKTFRTLTDWKQTAYMPTGRVKTSTWVADGAALIGDAAHAMNPHASQGRMQAMADAMALADLIPKCLEKGGVSAAALGEFERRRRPQVEMLQRLADEQVIFWNTGNPVLAFLRDRVFRTIGRNRRLSYRVLETTAGLRETPPFGLLDRLMAGGFLPDPNADLVEHA
ncbi:MAG: monooxygenase [Nitrospirae bacterium RIFCSPLOWO2_01_FULL_62_17]|nr:MAG: monooxygenase [Nitrospirae bacterium RIFCSPLOWO2_01_FULL_62_17]